MRPQLITELVATMDPFLASNNREIVRAVLGFVKVCVTSLPKELIYPRLHNLVPNLVSWSQSHRAHFKAKIKHILERMIRRYGYEAIEKHVPADDHKLVVNIRKTQDRKKRKRAEAAAANAEAGEDSDDGAAAKGGKRKSKFESEFEEAIYGSESESEDDDGDEEMGGAAGHKGANGLAGGKGRKKAQQQYIVEDEDEPLDLLNKNALAHITSTKPKAPTRGDRKVKSDIKTNKAGKFLIGRNGNDDEMDVGGGQDVDVDEPDLDISDKTIASGEVRDGISAYIQALKGKDAVQRGQRGRLKFSNKRRKDGDGDDDDMEMDDAEESTSKRGKHQTQKQGQWGAKHERKPSFGRKGDGRVQKPPKSPKSPSQQGFKQRGGGTASIGRRK